MFITVSFTESADQILSGIPRSVSIFASDETAIIYYTLDGSVPSMSSNLYSAPVELPTNAGTVTLAAIAYVYDGYVYVPSSILSNTWSTDHSDLDRYRYMFFEGLTYIYPGGSDIPYWYDANGDARVFIDEDPSEIPWIVSDRNADGSYNNELNNVISSDTPDLYDDQFKIFDTPSSATFNPEALYIVMDGREQQEVQLYNSPYMSLRDPRRNFRGLDFYANNGQNYISGSQVRTFINREKNLFVAYYFDSNSCRWVKSIQTLPERENFVPPSNRYTTPLVFQWNLYGRQQTI